MGVSYQDPTHLRYLGDSGPNARCAFDIYTLVTYIRKYRDKKDHVPPNALYVHLIYLLNLLNHSMILRADSSFAQPIRKQLESSV